MSDKPIRQSPVFHDARQIAANRERGLVDGAAAIAAVTAKEDKRSNDELLLDLLCSLRFWAEESGVSFHEALTGSDTHHMVETGKLAENFIRTLGYVNTDPPANVHKDHEFKFGQRVEVTSGPHWFGATGTIERWSRSISPFSASPIPGETSAEIKLDPEWAGKLAGPNITVVLAKLKHLTILEQPQVYKSRDLGDGNPVRVRECKVCGVRPSSGDDCGEPTPDCPYFGANLNKPNNGRGPAKKSARTKPPTN